MSDPAAAERPRAGLARRTASRGVGLLALTVLIGGVLAAPSSADFLHFPVKALAGNECTEAGGQFGERTASAGVGTDGDAGADFNADGVNDVWMAQPSCNGGSVTDQGRVYLLSGAGFKTGTTTILRTIDSPEPQANAKFGFAISVIGDVSVPADGKADIAIGTDSQDTTSTGASCTPGSTGCRPDQGKVWVFSGGSTGTLLYTLKNPVSQTGSVRFGSRIGRAGDITSPADAVPEVIVGASNKDVGSPKPRAQQGQAYIFDGASGGAPVRTLNMPTADQIAGGHFGLSVQGPGDVTGDGVDDQLVDASNFANGLSNQGRMYVFSGSTGLLARTINDPTPQANAYFGFQDVAPLSPGDLNNDTKADVYANGFLQDRSVADEGEAWVFSGADVNGTTVLSTLIDPTPELGGQFGWSMSKTDYNAGGVNDLYVGQAPHVSTSTKQNGGTYVFDGTTSTATVLKALELPTACQQTGSSTNNGPALGWTVSTPGNLNAPTDTVPDYVAGAPFFDRSNVDEGVVLAFLSGNTADPSKLC